MSQLDHPFGLLLATSAAMVSLLSQPIAAHAAPHRVECPHWLPPGSVPMRTTPEGWNMSASAPWKLDGSGILHGAPDEEAYLIPNYAHKTNRQGQTTSVRRWSFTVPHGFETWLYCTYGPVQLARPIPPTATECSATVIEIRGERISTVFACR